MSSDWTMPRRADVCVGCGHSFEIGETFQAILVEVGGEYERRDYCDNCPPPEQHACVGTWRTRRPEPASRTARPFDRQMIYGLFEQLEGSSEPARLQLRFVLALLLWRKKVLKLERTLTIGQEESWEFVAVGSGAAHRIFRPDLDEARLEKLSTQLEQLLAGQATEVDGVTAELGQEQADE